MHVQDIMTRSVELVSPTMTLAEAAEMMRDMDVGALPVGGQGRLLGMITDRDIVVRAVADGLDPAQTAVKNSMTPDLVYVYEDQEVDDAAALMANRRIRRLPVFDRGGALVGILSLADVTAARSGLAIRILESVSQPS